MTKYIFLIVVIVVLVIGGFVLLRTQSHNTGSPESPAITGRRDEPSVINTANDKNTGAIGNTAVEEHAPVGGEFTSTSEIVIKDILPCENNDAHEVNCTLLLVEIHADDPTTVIDDGLLPAPAVLAVRHLNTTSRSNPWVAFDSGGSGRGYATAFGGVDAGDFQRGRLYGDDLIRAYNDEGFVTIELVWSCAPGRCSSSVAAWLPTDTGIASSWGWLQNTGATGLIGIGSRERAILAWAQAQNGGKKLAAHGHSSGTGRLIIMLTRFGGDALLDAVVFDGGPIFAKSEWDCGKTGNPTDPAATSCGENLNAPSAKSFLLTASNRTFADTRVGVVFGGKDTSGAAPYALLWFGGFNGTPALNAETVHIIQGYCDPSSEGTYKVAGGFFPCSDWSKTNFPTAQNVTYNPELAQTTHSTAESQAGMRVLFETMMMLLE